jgi:fructose-specific phosphotransferase system IIA component
MRLDSLTDPGLIFPALDSEDAPDLLRTLARKIAEHGVVRDAHELFERLWEREQLGSTGIGSGIAIPHCKVQRLDRVVMAIAVAEEGIDFAAVDEQPVRLFFCVVSPNAAPAAHLQCLAAISRWIKANDHAQRILELQDPEAIYRLLAEEPEAPEGEG